MPTIDDPIIDLTNMSPHFEDAPAHETPFHEAPATPDQAFSVQEADNKLAPTMDDSIIDPTAIDVSSKEALCRMLRSNPPSRSSHNSRT